GGNCQWCRPRTEQCDTLAVLRLGHFRTRGVDLTFVVVSHQLQVADRDRLFLDSAPTTSRVTGPNADEAKNSREYVRLRVQHIGRCIAALCNEPDVLRDGGMARARPLAVYDLVEVLRIGDVCRSHPSAPGAHSGVALRHRKFTLQSFKPQAT